MRILITSSIYPTPEAPEVVGGAEIFVRRFAESLLERGDQVEVIRAASRPNQQMETCNGVDVYSSPVRNIYLPFTQHRNAVLRGIWHTIEDWEKKASLVSERIRAFKPDLLHSNNLSGLTTAVWSASSEQRIPIAHTLHDYYLTCPRCSRFSNGHSCEHTCMSCRILTVNRRQVASKLTAVIGVSQRILDVHTNLGLFADTPHRIVIRNAATIDPLPAEVMPGNGPITIGFIGRVTEEKGVYNLVKAVASIPAGSIRLLIAGRVSDDERKRIRTMAPEANIEFMGFVPPHEFYKQVDVVAVPSIWEDPGPLVVADALAAGKPLLGTRFGGIQEAIEHGVTGWLSDPDPEALAKAIAAIIDQPQQINIMSSKLAADADKWTFQKVIDAYRKVYRVIAIPRGTVSA